MAIDYYLDLNPETKNAEKNVIRTNHIGRAAYNWVFIFAPTDSIRSYKGWKKELLKGTIRNQFGLKVAFEDFARKVRISMHRKGNKRPKIDDGNGFKDAEGFYFLIKNFPK